MSHGQNFSKIISTIEVENYYFSILDVMYPYVQQKPIEILPHEEWRSKLQQSGIETFKKTDELTLQERTFAICSTSDSLKTLIRMGVHELRCWHSTIHNPLYPHWCILSISGDEFREVADASVELNRFLSELEIHSYPKLAAGALDVYIPLGGKFQYDQVRQFGELVSTVLTEEWSIHRKENVKISYEKNAPLNTAPAPYSLLFADRVFVFTPLLWDELNESINPPQFSLEESLNRISAYGDFFKPVLEKGVELNKLIKGLSHLLPI